MFCPTCGNNTTDTNGVCDKCSATATTTEPAAPTTPDVQPVETSGLQSSIQINFDYQSFINFKTMITPSILKFVYIGGVITIALVSLLAMFTGGVPGFFMGLIGGLIVGAGLVGILKLKGNV